MASAMLLAVTAEASALMTRVFPIVTAAAFVLLAVVYLRRPRASKDLAHRKKVRGRARVLASGACMASDVAAVFVCALRMCSLTLAA